MIEKLERKGLIDPKMPLIFRETYEIFLRRLEEEISTGARGPFPGSFPDGNGVPTLCEGARLPATPSLNQ